MLIRGGTLYDGTGADGRRADVRVVDGRVAAVSEAPLEAHNGERVVDAAGCWVMPGFLDTHTHYDAEILVAPGLHESVRHGVTTVCMGSCSLSTILSEPEDCADFFCRVEALPRDAVLPALERHKTWDTPAAYIEGLERRALGPNVACFLGHSDMRTAVMGLGRAVDARVKPTADEHAAMARHLHEALDAGFLGMSTMTNPWDKVGGARFRSSRLPSTYATWGEYRRLHRILRARDRVLQSAPNITTRYNVLAFAAEALGLFRKPLKVALISAADTKAARWLVDAVLAFTGVVNGPLGGNLRWQTVPMPFEVYADGMDLVIFEEFGAGEAALHLADELERNALLAETSYRRWFRKDYERRFSPRVWQRDFHDAVIVSAPDPTLAGKTFGALADAQGIHPVDAFLDLVVAHGSRLRWKTTIANDRAAKLARIASSKHVHVGFADSGAHVRNMAFYNFGLAYLRLVKESHERGAPVASFGEAVRKLTGEQADWYGLDAGYVRRGDRADITVIDPTGLGDALDGYHEAPMTMFGGLPRMVRRNDDAVRATIIGGQAVFERGVFADGFGADKRTGSYLRVGERCPPPAATAGRDLNAAARQGATSGAGQTRAA